MNVVPFRNKNQVYEKVSLSDWIISHPSEDDLRTVFINMDRALKYIHEHGYCIEVFYPTEIEVLGNSPEYIQFKKLLELSSDPGRRREMIKEDIFHSSLIQIGIYTNSLKYINPNFVKENFDSFIQLLPSEDVPYYRGVVQRGASVYFCEYVLEKRNKDLDNLEKQLEESGGTDKGRLLTKTSNKNIGIESITNDKINDEIYAQINGMRDSAFINFLVIPTLILIVLLILGLITLMFSFA